MPLTIDWVNDLVTAGIVLTFEIAVLLPIGIVLTIRWIRAILPSLLLELAGNPDFQGAIRKLAEQLGPGLIPKINLKQAAAYGLFAFFQRWASGQPLIPGGPPQLPPPGGG